MNTRFLSLLLCALVATVGFASGSSDATAEPSAKKSYPPYLSLQDGLHVTGKPIEVDIESYRLQVVGLVDRPLQLSYSDVLAMESQRRQFDLVCEGFFVDTGHWTEVDVLEVLKPAGVKERATGVEFSSIDGSYTQRVSFDDLREGTYLIAYEFEDEPFPVYHGFPLRLAAESVPGYVWVKWLGIIEVVE